jgi:preprotein translocase subunit SecD
MKKLVEIIFLLLISQFSYAGESEVSFVVTSDCVTSIEVKKSIYTESWDLVTSLNEEAANNLFKLSSNNIGNKLTMYDGNNFVVISAIVREPLPSSFATSGIESEEEALKIKKSILESKGKCGVK